MNILVLLNPFLLPLTKSFVIDVCLVNLLVTLRESRNSVSTCNLVTETELQLLFIGMINSERVNNVTS
jgi:hypothetical protein